MRILNNETDQALKNIDIYLTPSEAQEMRDSLSILLSRPEQQHAHVNDKEFKHEVTVVIYTDSNMKGFSSRLKKLILEGK